jgi:hypothetical protein
MPHARDSNKLLELASDELRPVVGDNSWLRFMFSSFVPDNEHR